ncbi:homologous-pairing protein 2 homolog [Leguminivora glycinivorella]|uniref:homologous-pairing protein 2 homolog n=1 Tax=Leguminivora glycinivorella TaxID=1035111 RepID=UPI0020103C59|nr:homologous-pairing protein 2 homolog [Leguminivora glycinivorella]
MANEAVLKYLVDTNRPYSCADVTVNLRGAFTKSAVQKALDYLSENAKIRCKLYGKQKVYAAIQPENVVEEGDTEDYDAQCKSITEELLEKSNTLKTTEINLKTILSAPTTDSAKSQIEELKRRIEGFENKLKVLSTSTNIISAEEKTAIMSQHEKFLKEYRKRKRISSDIIEAVLEGYPKSKKSFLEELCIETDEMVNFKLMN